MPRAFALTAVATLGLAGCTGDLPSASFIEKLRVLAVRASPPEVEPGEATALDALVVEPPVQLLDGGPTSPVSYLWLACPIPPGASSQVPCGLDATDGVLPSSVSLLGTQPQASFTPPASVLGERGTGQILITLVVADSAGGATGCLTDAAANEGQPQNPDRCVIAIKRLMVSDPNRTLSDGSPAPARNQNPALAEIFLTDEDMTTHETLEQESSSATFALAPEKNAKALRWVATRAAESAELEKTYDDDGNVTGDSYEALTLAWFVTAGTIDGGRSLYAPPGENCPTQSSCPTVAPEEQADTHWTPPTADELAQHSPEDDRTVHFYAVIRDDRGGVSWQEGVAAPR